MFPANFFLRLPPAVAVLAVSSLTGLARAHALPRQTKTVELREIDALPWPLQAPAAPTPAPADPELHLRQLNTVCGYIGGDPALPATCSAGSHCAVDAAAGAVGCCPDGAVCSQGIYTGCVDANSDPQTEINPYVYTCGGTNACYKNSFGGGYFQYGCGSASGLGTTVAMAASGQESLDIASVTLELTATATALSEPTTIGSRTATDSTSESTSETSTQTSSETTSSETASDTAASDAPTNTDSSAPDASDDDDQNVGAIVGGTIGGVGALVALVALGLFLWRRKRGNARKGPGDDQETKYISPMTDGNHPFERLSTTQEPSEATTPPNLHPGHRVSGEFSSDSNDGPIPYQPTYPYGYGPGSMAGGVMAVGRAEDGNIDPDRVPLTREIDDFSRGFNTALDEIQEDSTPPSNEYNMSSYPGPRGGEGARPLWQQNRRQSRNLMWM